MKAVRIQYNRSKSKTGVTAQKKSFVRNSGRPINFSSAGYRNIDKKDIYFRSIWEANFARYLTFQKKQSLIKDWEHEPQTFWFESIKRGVRSYLPDFKVHLHDGKHYWVEVKGYYDQRSITKIKRFKKYYPDESLHLIDKTWFGKNNKTLSLLIPGWEKGR